MNNPLGMLDLALLLNRLAIGLLFLLAGKTKVAGGVSNFVSKVYVGMVPPWVPHWFAWPYGYAVPWLEMVFGGLLILGFLGRLTSTILFLMLASFTIAMAHAGMLTKNAGPINPNFIYLAMLFLLMITGPGRLSGDAILRRRRASTKTTPSPH